MATDDLDSDDNDLEVPGHNLFNQQEADKLQSQADTDAAVTADLLKNERYDAFFAAYQPKVRAEFTYRYVMLRQNWVECGQDHERRPQRQYTPHQAEAYTALWAIQQKKLFDLQCRWRAEEVTNVPDVLIADDFAELSRNIENCPALSPITPDELALYLDWVRQADYALDFDDRHDQRFAWQNYRQVREALAPAAPPAGSRAMPISKAVPGWYTFHNQHTGNDRLLHLPDVRGHKEARYMDAWREGQQEKDAIRAAAAPPPDPRPAQLSQEEHQALARDFAQQFEPPRLNRWREVSELLYPPATDRDRHFSLMLSLLQLHKEPEPVAAAADWREAVREAYAALSKRKLLEHLPEVYAEYAQNQEWGIAHVSRFDWEPMKFNMAEFLRRAILDGRERLGEPANFDF